MGRLNLGRLLVWREGETPLGGGEEVADVVDKDGVRPGWCVLSVVCLGCWAAGEAVQNVWECVEGSRNGGHETRSESSEWNDWDGSITCRLEIELWSKTKGRELTEISPYSVFRQGAEMLQDPAVVTIV
jgi:hypothetical protein